MIIKNIIGNNLMMLLISLIIYSSTISIVHAAAKLEIKGSGSTVSGGLIKEWGNLYGLDHPVNIKYTANTPVIGVAQLLNDEVDFAVVDMPLSNDELKSKNLHQFPFSLVAVTPVINIPGITSGRLQLNAKVFGDILFGKIKKWNDPAITSLNKDVNLPNENIVLIHRKMTYQINNILTDYLSKSYSGWAEAKPVDMNSSIWPASSEQLENPLEILKKVKETPYSIGYGPIYGMEKMRLTYIKMQNKEGEFVSPYLLTAGNAADNTKWIAEDNGFSQTSTNQPGKGSWPITTASFIVMKKNVVDRDKSLAALSFFRFHIKSAMWATELAHFVHLPEKVGVIITQYLQDKIKVISGSLNNSPSLSALLPTN